jgi:hypothetical protein
MTKLLHFYTRKLSHEPRRANISICYTEARERRSVYRPPPHLCYAPSYRVLPLQSPSRSVHGSVCSDTLHFASDQSLGRADTEQLGLDRSTQYATKGKLQAPSPPSTSGLLDVASRLGHVSIREEGPIWIEGKVSARSAVTQNHLEIWSSSVCLCCSLRFHMSPKSTS